MKKPGSSSSKAVPPFLHTKGIPHAALLALSPCFCGLDVPPDPRVCWVLFVCLVGWFWFSSTFHRTHPDCTQAAKPGFPALLSPFSATQLLASVISPSVRATLGLQSSGLLLIQYTPPFLSPPVLVSLRKGCWGHILTCLLHAPPPEIFPFRNPRVPSPDPSFAPVAADTIS